MSCDHLWDLCEFHSYKYLTEPMLPDTVPHVWAQAHVGYPGKPQRHVFEDNLNYHHTVWDLAKMGTTGNWYDSMKVHIQFFSEHRRMARTHKDAIIVAGSDFESVAPYSPVVMSLALNGLGNIPSPSTGTSKLEVSM